ncbi:DUF433 domain-containing protein [Candidatus Palauibacter sp.]|uniref:DUF433 domain-containing protein n=1 Tax=Candidatus Palauibacter sp. TaxID=3101350 RepID=UPI003AF2A175
MLNWETCAAVERDPRKVSGARVFAGTRVPVRALFENLRAGASILFDQGTPVPLRRHLQDDYRDVAV